MTARRVVLTGRGVVSPLGVGVDAHWDALCTGRSGVARLDRLAALGLPASRGGWTVPSTAPKPIVTPPAPGAVAVIPTTSPSARYPRVVPSGSVTGRLPSQVISSRQPRSPGRPPETVPEANRSPVRSAAPLTVAWASCCGAVQYMPAAGGWEITWPLTAISIDRSSPHGSAHTR